MHIHWLQHVDFENLGYIESWLQSRHITSTVTRFFAADTLPELNSFDGLVVMGGPMSVNDESIFPWLRDEKTFIAEAIQANKPVLGICLGAQLIASVLGARVSKNNEKEIGWHEIRKTDKAGQSPFAHFLPERQTVFHWHGERFEIPQGAIHLYASDACAEQAFIYNERVVGLQCHLETLPANAEALLENCADELVGGRYIQSAEAIRHNQGACLAMTATLETMLDYLFTA